MAMSPVIDPAMSPAPPTPRAMIPMVFCVDPRAVSPPVAEAPKSGLMTVLPALARGLLRFHELANALLSGPQPDREGGRVPERFGPGETVGRNFVVRLVQRVPAFFGQRTGRGPIGRRGLRSCRSAKERTQDQRGGKR